MMILLNGTYYRLHNGVVQYRHKHGDWREAMIQNWDWFVENGRLVS